MKIYCLLFIENSHAGHLFAVDPFLNHESALAAMRADYERKLAALPFDVSLQTEWHRCSCEKNLASIIDGTGTYIWCVQERELDVQVAVEVQGGLVQVYDLDLTDIQGESGPSEGELRQAALAEAIRAPGWRIVS